MASELIKNISGQIAGVNLSSFLQMIEMDQKTCSIKIFTKKNVGQIFFLDGVLIDAETIHLKHLQALYDILAWKNIVLEVTDNDSRRENRINMPLMHVLMESARISDEDRADADNRDSGRPGDPPEKSIPLKVMKNNDFSLDIGTRLLIDFDDLDISFRSTLVGIEYGKYLLIKGPKSFSPKDEERFKVTDLIVKTLYKGTIYAFRSRLMAFISNPSRLMFVEYPRKIEHHELRSHKRFKCSIVTRAKVREQGRDGVIENISEGGCLCVLETFPTDHDLAGNIVTETIPFRCSFPGSNGEVSFLGEIRNAKKKPEEIIMGIKFVYPEAAGDGPEDYSGTKQVIKNFIRLIESSTEKV